MLELFVLRTGQGMKVVGVYFQLYPTLRGETTSVLFSS